MYGVGVVVYTRAGEGYLDNDKTRTGCIGTGKVNVLLVVRDIEALDGGGCVRARIEGDRVSCGGGSGQANGQDGVVGLH